MARSVVATAAAAVLLIAGCAGGGSRLAGAKMSTPSASGARLTYLGLPVTVVQPTVVLDQPGTGWFSLAQPEKRRLWVGSPTGLSWIDPADNSVHRVDDRRGVALAIYGGSLYRSAYEGGDVARYDVAGDRPRERARTRYRAPLIVTAGPQGIWVSDHWSGVLSRLDPDTLAVRCSVTVGAGDGLALAGQVWVGGRMWVVSQRDQRLYEIDPRACRVLRHVDLGATPADDIIVEDRTIFVCVVTRANSPITELQVVDAASARLGPRVTASEGVALDDDGGGGATPPVVVDGRVWVPSGPYLVRLDRVHEWRPDRVVQIAAPAGFAARWSTVAFGSVWLSSMNAPVATVRLDQAALR